jgi:hypothetical protein
MQSYALSAYDKAAFREIVEATMAFKHIKY